MTRCISALSAYGRAQGLTVRFVCWDVMRSWVIDMIKYTSPWASGVPGNSLNQRDAGYGAIGKDLLGYKQLFSNRRSQGLFRAADGPAVERTWLWSAAKNSSSGSVKMVATQTSYGRLIGKRGVKFHGGAVLVVDETMWKPQADIQEMQDFHLRYRRKDGRVSSAGSWSKDVGRWKPIGMMFVNQQGITQYIKHVKKRVGSLKAGWIPALFHYASLCRGSIGRLQQWILGQSVKAGGFGGNMDVTGNGFIYADNTAHHSRAIRTSAAELCRDKQGKNLNRFARYRLERLIKQFNSGSIPKPILQATA